MKHRAVTAVAITILMVFSVLAPAQSASAQDAEVFTLKGKRVFAEVEFSIGDADDGDLELVTLFIQKTGAGHAHLVVESIGCESDPTASCIETRSPATNLKLRISKDRTKAVIQGTYGGDQGTDHPVRLVLTGLGDPNIVTTTERINYPSGLFEKTRTRSRMQPSQVTGTFGDYSVSNTDSQQSHFSIDRIRYTSNDPIDDIPPNV